MRLYPLVLFPLAAFAAAQPHYNSRLTVEPESATVRVAGSLTLTIDADNQREARFYLNRGFDVKRFGCTECYSFSFDRTHPEAYQYARQSATLAVRFKRAMRRGERVKFDYVYEGKMAVDEYATNYVHANNAELGMYCAWFPMQPALGRFTYDVTLQTDPKWKVAAAGDVRELGRGAWRIGQQTPTFDIDIAASNRLKQRKLTADGAELELAWMSMPDDRVERAAQSSLAVLKQFREWFGAANETKLKLVFVDRERGGGYARPGYITYSAPYMSKLDDATLTKELAHEIGHLWWSRGPVETWEDWLNESYTEYSALMAVRQLHSASAFEEMLARDAADVIKTPPIRGIDRRSNEAWATLYQKGALVLHTMDERLSTPVFLKVMAELNRAQVATTVGALDVFERVGSVEARREVERLLDLRGWPSTKNEDMGAR